MYTCPIAAVRHFSRPVYGLQFHPEVGHTPEGPKILRNFLYDVCGCRDLQVPGPAARGSQIRGQQFAVGLELSLVQQLADTFVLLDQLATHLRRDVR